MKLKQKLGIAYIRAQIKLIAALSKRKAAEKAFEIFCTPFARYKRKSPPEVAVPTTFISSNITINGYKWNPAQQKKALILHGFSSAAYKFDSYAAMLVQKGYEVLSFDAPAHGDSGGKTTNAIEYSEMIQKAVELYGPIDSFIAHSFGGIALSLAMEIIPHNADTKIVLIAPATETTSAIDGAFAMLGIKDAAVRKEMDQLVFEKAGHYPEWFSIKRAVKNIKAQLLWIHDEDDDITPLKDALEVKRSIILIYSL
ncbi:alpha/beta hydrolase [Ferruginibacter sp.]